MNKQIEKQARSFHKALSVFVKKYQLRNRNDICCDDVTVSQCYVMEALAEHQTLTMNELAGQMQLSVSTMTRVTDHIIEKGYAIRYQDGQDRRVWYITLTEKGRKKIEEMENRFIEHEKKLLHEIAPKEREHIINLINELSATIDKIRSCDCPVNKKQ